MGRHGENIHKRKDGRWEARIIQGYTHSGKAHYKSIYGRSYLEAKKKRDAFRLEAGCGKVSVLIRSAELTFGNVAADWLSYKKPMIKESTYACYSFILDHYLLPELGDIPIHKLDSERLDQFLIQEMEHGSACSPGCGALAAKTVSDHKTVLLSVFRYAYSRKYVTAVPECMPIPHEQPHIRVLTKKEQKLLEQAALEADTPICFAIFLSLYAGLRIGEACALRWEDFDFTNGTVMVNKTVIRIRNTDSSRPGKSIVIIDRPKTRCSNRIIPLADPILNYLRPRCREPFIYVATGTPNYIEPRLCLKHYKKILKQAGIADYNYHALRHTFATRCIENGFDIKSLSEIMGHSSVNVTMQRYVHPSLDLKKEQMNRLSNLTVWNQE